MIFKRVNRVTGQTGCGSNGSGQTGLTRFAMSTLIACLDGGGVHGSKVERENE